MLSRATLNKPSMSMGATNLLDIDLTRFTVATMAHRSTPMSATSEQFVAGTLAQRHAARAALHLELGLAALTRPCYHGLARRARTRVAQKYALVLALAF